MDFDDIKTYDEAIADEGIMVPIKRGGKVILKAKLRYVDPFTQAGEIEYKRARAPFAKLFKVDALDDFDAAIIALTYVNMVGWEGPTSGGKPVAFDSAVARKFFSKDSNKWMALELLKVCNDPENYVADEFDVEQVTKN